jgi:hypothetical protein
LIAPAAPLLAQDPALRPGDRVRVQQPDHRPITGTLIAVRSDSILIDRAGGGGAGEVAVPRLAPGVTLDVSTGKGTHAGLGALIGGGLGTAATLVFLQGFCGGDTLCDGDEQVKAFAILALPPAVVGGVIGAFVPRERWRSVDWSRIRIAVRGTDGGIGLGLTIGF